MQMCEIQKFCRYCQEGKTGGTLTNILKPVRLQLLFDKKGRP